MIAHLQGALIRKSPADVIIDVTGVGYQVFITLPTYYELPGLGTPVSLNIHTHVREGEFRLFGFSTREEQTIFEKLISVSKVGPKLAIAILSGMPVEDFVSAIMNKDIARLNAIPGVGAKTAERLALEMKDKLKDLAPADLPTLADMGEDGVKSDALSALVNLGYKKQQAEKALASVVNHNQGEVNLELLIKECLKVL